MNLILKFLLIFTLLITGEVRNSVHLLDELGEKIRAGYVFEADMEHEFTDAFTQETMVNNGRIWIGENRYKVVTADQEITVQGNVSTVFNRAQNKVIISTYFPEEDDFAPSRFLGNIADTFVISEFSAPHAGIATLSLQSKDVFEMISKARIQIREADLIPVSIYAEDQTDNVFLTQFNNGRFIPNHDSIFALDWPANATVIDLREE